jgi:hexulose-6-phosphate isomerase
LQTALRDSKAYGGTTVLLVVGVVNKEISYADAYKRTQEEIRKVLPLAAELQIKIAFENVWNMFLLSPLEFAKYIDDFESPWVGAYFDIGNVVNYGWPEQWIRTLGKRIAKLDVKEYSRKLRDEKGPYAGFQAELGEGDCDWPAVLKALDDIGYTGWGTAEVKGGDRARLLEVSQRMDRVLALK